MISAFSTALNEFGENIESVYFREELKQLVGYLCYPVPDQRGHPRNFGRKNRFDLERIITRLDVLRIKAEYSVKH